MGVRRVVTGVDAEGKSVFVSDGDVDPINVSLMPGTVFHNVWGSDEVVKLPSDGSHPSARTYFPPTNGFRVSIFTLGPDTVTLPEDLDIGAAFAEMNEKLVGMADWLERDHPGMHTTDTVDVDMIVSGEIWLELDDGAEVHLEAGDFVVQNGTRHAWHNRSSEPCTMLVSLIGAHRA